MRRNFSLSLIVTVITVALTIFSGIVLARSLGPTDRGVLATVILWPALLLSIANIGLQNAATVFAACGDANLPKLVGTVTWITVLVGAIIFFFGLLLIPLVLGNQADGVEAGAYIYLATMPIGAFVLNGLGLLNGLGRHTTFQVVRLLVMLIITSGIVVVWLAGAISVRNAVVPHFLANTVALAVIIVMIRRELNGSIEFDLALARQLIGFGLRGHVGSITSLLNERLDQLVMSVFLLPAQLGIYVVALTLAAGPALFGTAAAPVAMPTLAKTQSREDRRANAELIVSVTFFLSVVGAGMLLVFGSRLIELFFGEAFGAATSSMKLLAAAAIPLGCCRVLTAALIGVGFPQLSSVAELLALISTTVGLAILLPSYGIEGAALTSLVAYSVSFLFLGWKLASVLGTSFQNLVFHPGFQRFRIIRRTR